MHDVLLCAAGLYPKVGETLKETALQKKQLEQLEGWSDTKQDGRLLTVPGGETLDSQKADTMSLVDMNSGVSMRARGVGTNAPGPTYTKMLTQLGNMQVILDPPL